MGAIAEAVAGAFDGLSSFGFNLYDRWYQAKNNQRDFDYQKALQQDVFNREDTAVQRRMADLQAAGLNPNLAAGSAASSGAVVGRSSTPGLPTFNSGIGAALDTAAAVSQLRAQREQNKILGNQAEQSDYEKDLTKYNYSMAKLQTMMERASMWHQMGVNNVQLKIDKNGKASLWSPDFVLNGKGEQTLDLDKSPLFKMIDWEVQNGKNAADLLQRDVDWYTADKVADYLGAGVQMFSGFGSGWKNFGFGKKK